MEEQQPRLKAQVRCRGPASGCSAAQRAPPTAVHLPSCSPVPSGHTSEKPRHEVAVWSVSVGWGLRDGDKASSEGQTDALENVAIPTAQLVTPGHLAGGHR